MASIVNADNGSVSGSAGLKSSADSSGVLALQTNGTTAVTISTGQVATFAQAPVLPAASIPQAALAAGVAGNGPSFQATNSSTQSLSSGVFTKALLNSESWDTNSNFDTTLYRFTPNAAGYYQFNTYFYYGTANSYEMITILVKNGASLGAYLADSITSSSRAVNGSRLAYMNGTTDYMEMYVYINVAASITAGNLLFEGFMVRAA